MHDSKACKVCDPSHVMDEAKGYGRIGGLCFLLKGH